MRSFYNILTLLFALFALTFAQGADTISYDATVVITSTVYRVNTVYQKGAPTGDVMNMTSTIPAVRTASSTVTSTGAAAAASHTGAASAVQINAFAAALVAGVGYLVL